MAKIRTSPIDIAEFAALPCSSNNGGASFAPETTTKVEPCAVGM